MMDVCGGFPFNYVLLFAVQSVAGSAITFYNETRAFSGS